MSLQVFDYDKEEDDNNNSEQGSEHDPYNHNDFKCPHCNSSEVTLLEKEASFLTYILAFVSLFLFGFLSIIILPLIIQSSKTVVRRCADCNEVVEQTNLFSLPSLKDEIMNFQCGNCSVVISRKYALILIGIFAICYLYYIMTQPPSPNSSMFNSNELPFVKWEQFVKDCGQTVQLNNEVKAKQIFEKKYKNKIIEWEGALLGIRTHQFMNSFQALEQSYAHVFIKMSPTDSAYEAADIRLDYDRYQYEKDQNVYQFLDVGNVIKFKGKFLNLGDEQNANVLEVISIENLNKKLDIHDIPLIELQEDEEQELKLRKKKGEKTSSSHPHHKSHSQKGQKPIKNNQTLITNVTQNQENQEEEEQQQDNNQNNDQIQNQLNNINTEYLVENNTQQLNDIQSENQRQNDSQQIQSNSQQNEQENLQKNDKEINSEQQQDQQQLEDIDITKQNNEQNKDQNNKQNQENSIQTNPNESENK